MTKSSTTKGQRIGIWVIAALMALGTVGSLVAVLLANENAGKDEERLQKMMNDYNTEVENHNSVLSKKYFDSNKTGSATMVNFKNEMMRTRYSFSVEFSPFINKSL